MKIRVVLGDLPHQLLENIAISNTDLELLMELGNTTCMTSITDLRRLNLETPLSLEVRSL